jgi:cyclohexyl-isocyanide hydratase
MILGIPVYEGVDLLDVTGPFELFSWVDKSKGLTPILISEDGKPVRSGNGVFLGVHSSFSATPNPDVVWVPGGAPDALQSMLPHADSPYFNYLRQAALRARWMCSVCEGALLLARAGLLAGHQATTHWAFTECLSKFEGVTVVPGHPRFVVSGDRLTGGGISSGLDEALQLIKLLFGTATAEAVQVLAQYFPAPPVSGTIPPAPKCKLHW